MKHIFIGHHYFGAGNFGDDLTLAGFLTLCSEQHAAYRFTVCTSHNRESQTKRFPHVNWLPDDETSRRKALGSADVWLGLGDTPFQLDSGEWMLDHLQRETAWCAQLKKPMYFLGIGCESARAVQDPRARAVITAAQHIWTRDALSQKFLTPYCVSGKMSQGADLAHLVFTPEPPAPEPATLALLPAFERAEQLDLSELETFIMRHSELRLRWLVQEFRSFPYVERWNLEGLTEAPRARLHVMELDYGTISVEDYLQAFGSPEIVVSSRYHTALIAAWHGARIVILTRSAKLQGIAEEFELPAIEELRSAKDLDEAITHARSVEPVALMKTRQRAETACKDFFQRIQ